eukprot:TRINITY_DN11865_c1_g1_i1.p1 TRINITY_DN11865_c1_g1~~TRINITY_DN11865_c1_g1_i1.p1  ORF type:complete len:240 (+),score=74.05 TRINITY_DN11865_c1_g1_i1:283-1002(+)
MNSLSQSSSVLKVDTVYEARYYGFALTKGGTNKAMETYSERSVQAVIKSGCRPIKIRIRMTDDRVTLASALSNQMVASFSIRDMRCFSRHKDHGPRNKPKFMSLMTRNTYNSDPSKEYQCYMFHFAKTEIAESFVHMLNYICQELHRGDIAKEKLLYEQQQQQQQQQPQPVVQEDDSQYFEVAPHQQQYQQQQQTYKAGSASLPTSPQVRMPQGYNSAPNTPKVNVRMADAPPVRMGWS